jgi:hypothetical protein
MRLKERIHEKGNLSSHFWHVVLESPKRRVFSQRTDPCLIIKIKRPFHLLQTYLSSQSNSTLTTTSQNEQSSSMTQPQSIMKHCTPLTSAKIKRKFNHNVDVSSFYESLRPSQNEITPIEEVSLSLLLSS